jgi:hypothetical protein
MEYPRKSNILKVINQDWSIQLQKAVKSKVSSVCQGNEVNTEKKKQFGKREENLKIKIPYLVFDLPESRGRDSFKGGRFVTP